MHLQLRSEVAARAFSIARFPCEHPGPTPTPNAGSTPSESSASTTYSSCQPASSRVRCAGFAITAERDPEASRWPFPRPATGSACDPSGTTKKLFAVLGPVPMADPPPEPDGDDWYADLLWFERRKCLLTHAGTLFTVSPERSQGC